jgi:phosphoribosylaminoimidazole carboxylase PurE protein
VQSQERKTPRVGIYMGSASDAPVMEEALKTLREFGIPCEMTVASAHRSPERAHRLATTAESRGIEVIIVGAGGAAHLAGTMAANCVLPVIGVPLESSALKGLDALLATVQMPGGIPVATMAIGKAGAKNAAILAAQILARKDQDLARRLHEQRRSLAAGIEESAREVESR